MKFGHLIEYEAGRVVPEHFLFITKAIYQVKARGLQLSFDVF